MDPNDHTVNFNRSAELNTSLATNTSSSPKTTEFGFVYFHFAHLRHQLRDHSVENCDHTRLFRRMSMYRGACCKNDTILCINRTVGEGGY